MSLLVDTTVVLELRKGARCDARVRTFFEGTSEELYLSALTLGELRAGVERLRRRDAKEARVWDRWLHQVVTDHGERVLPIDEAVVEEWGLLLADARSPGAPRLTTRAGLLAATALAYDLTLVTRSSRALEATGARVVDPFA